MRNSSSDRVFGVGVFLGLSFDILFWRQSLGVNFPLYTLLVVIGGLLALRFMGEKPSRAAWPLILLTLAFPLGTAVRAEPLSQFLGVAATLMLMGIVAASAASGEWLGYRFRDFFDRALRLALGALSNPLTAVRREPGQPPATSPSFWKSAWAVLRGLLVAAPILLVFSSLLASADPVFERWLSLVLGWLDLERLPEYIFRMAYISVGAYLLAGIYFFMVARRRAGVAPEREESRPLLPLLGPIEAATILALVDVLFLAFVVIQFTYFFGGHVNIHVSGYTFAEYARRGFAELVAVAVFSLLLIIALSSLTSHPAGRSRTAFVALNIGLVSLLAVILVSSAQRLTLYEEAYGFTRLRTYTHVFIFWLGLLLIALATFEVLQRTRLLALACLAAGIGFSGTILALNVDAFIVRMNVERARAGQPLDVAYLASLSTDALPELAGLWANAEPTLKSSLAAALACHAQLNDQYEPNPGWRGFHLSVATARQTWRSLPEADALAALIIEDRENYAGWHYVLLDGEPLYCEASGGWD